jgi:predicted aspartyl protease
LKQKTWRNGSLFLDKYLEIDYNKQLLIIHDNMPLLDSSWIKTEMQLDGGVRPMIPAVLEMDGAKYTDWYIFDTGNSGNGIISNELTARYGIYDKFNKIIGFAGKKIAGIPKIIIAGFSFENGTIVLEKPGANLLEKSVIGNKILSRLNVVIDNRHGYLYLKPNKLFK